jgi:hypothetical protein
LSDIAFGHCVLAKWLTVRQAAKKYGCCDRSVREWLSKWTRDEGDTRLPDLARLEVLAAQIEELETAVRRSRNNSWPGTKRPGQPAAGDDPWHRPVQHCNH